MATSTATLLRLSAICATASAAWATVRADNLDGAATPLDGPAVTHAANLAEAAFTALAEARLPQSEYPETWAAYKAAVVAYGNLQAARTAYHLADAAARLAMVAMNADKR